MCLSHHVKQLLSLRAKYRPAFVHWAKLSSLSSFLQMRYLHPNHFWYLVFPELSVSFGNYSPLRPKPCQGSCSYLERHVIMGMYWNIHPSIWSTRSSNLPLYLICPEKICVRDWAMQISGKRLSRSSGGLCWNKSQSLTGL